jgi:winged helix DNA-binding protein
MREGEIVRRRMVGQFLWRTRLTEPVEVVRELAAVQAQEYPIALWSVGQRARGVREADVERALSDGRLVRTHALRPTWHLVLAEDLRWIHALTAPRVHAMNARLYRLLELDPRLLARTTRLLGRAVTGGRYRTRTELADVLRRSGIEAAGSRLAHIVMHAELEAVICSGPMRGRRHTYASVDERVSNTRRLDREEALAELARRYFRTRGPATARDFAWWSSLTIADVREAIGMLSAELEQAGDGPRIYWFVPGSPPSRRGAPRADLVQAYDEVLISYRESRDVVTHPFDLAALPQGRVPFMHAVLLDGVLVGRWRTNRDGAPVGVETSLARGLRDGERVALERAVGRFRGFVGPAAGG